MEEKNTLFAKQEEEVLVAEEVSTKKFLVFESDEMFFGIDVDYMEEIITNHVITYLPMVPSFVRGVINLRGQVIPVIDVRMRLGRPSKENFCVIVLNVEDTEIGLLVDTVAQIVDIEKDALQPMPANNQTKFVSGVCTLPDGKTMMMLDCQSLLEG